MRIDMAAKGIAVGVGIVDEVFETLDEDAARTAPFKKWADFERVGGAILMTAGEVLLKGTMAKVCSDASGPFITLLTKSVAKPIKKAIRERTTAETMHARGGPALTPRGHNPSPGWQPQPIRGVAWQPQAVRA